MRIRSALAFSLLLISAAACGGDDGVSVVDGGGGGGDGGGSGAGQIGARCTMDIACPADLPICAVLSDGATEGFCTKECGLSPDDETQPAGGNDACQAGYSGTATPGCVVSFPPREGMVPWGCALACGGQFGTCPDNLECIVMQDDAGFCLPP